jgi:hypothetical protein
MKQSYLRKNLKDWARRRHYDVCGVFTNNNLHQRYLTFCDKLEYYTDVNIWGSSNLDENWEKVLESLNKIDEKYLTELENQKHE